jgi:hypothetical protein
MEAAEADDAGLHVDDRGGPPLRGLVQHSVAVESLMTVLAWFG